MRRLGLVAACSTLAVALASATAAADVPPPGTPADLRAATASNAAVLAWDANPEPYVSGYVVERDTGAGWTALRTEPTGPTFTDTTVTNGATVAYRVRARSVTSALSGASASVSVTVRADTTSPATPANLRVAGTTGAVAAAWDENQEADLAGYEVWRQVGAGSWTNLGLLTDPNGVDRGLAAGTTYSYRVRAKDRSGLFSAYTVTRSATPSADATAPAAPTNVAAHIGDGEATLTWDRGAEADLSGAYVVGKRCAAPPATPYTYWGKATTNRFRIQWLDNNIEWCFYIRAVDWAGNASPWQPSVERRFTPDRALLRLGINGGSDFSASYVLPQYDDLGYPDVRIELDVGVPAYDPAGAQVQRAIADLTARAVRPLVLAGYGGAYPTRAQVEYFCGEVAGRYGPGGSAGLADDVAVRHIEFGNESSYSYYSGTYRQPAVYAGLLEACIDAAKARNPFVGVLGQADDPTGIGWVDAIYAADTDRDLNGKLAGWTSHPYGRPDRIRWLLGDAVAQTAEHGSTAPFFLTEYGFATDQTLDGSGNVVRRRLTCGYPPCNYGWQDDMTYAEAAAELPRILDHIKATYPRVTQVFYYGLHDGAAPGASTDQEKYFGLLDSFMEWKEPLANTFSAIVQAGGR